MWLSWIELVNFRNYGSLRWEPADGVNVLVGRNAAGKTNLLESIGYLSTLRSFRKAPDGVLIEAGSERAVVRGEVVAGSGSTLIELELARVGRRRTLMNRARLGRAADLLGKVRCVVFLPDDLDLVKRGPGYRRELLDSIAVQLWPGAYSDQREYERTVRQRNRLLKQMGRRVDPVSLEVWDDRLALAGARMMARRSATIEAIATDVSDYYRNLAAEATAVSIVYRSVWGADQAEGLEGWADSLRRALGEARSVDLDRRLSTVGPHRDDVVILLDERDARMTASQGEQRTLTLALRLAAHQAIRAVTGESPLLLLDDVFSELDGRRATALARCLPSGQAFITTARAEHLPFEGRTWHLKDGAWQ